VTMEPLSGDDPTQVAGYQVRARLGAGGMGRVYLAYTPGGRPVALKVVRSEFGSDADFRERFRHEVDAARRVHGLYTAQVLDADPDATPPWLVTAYVPGPSLQQAVKQHGPMPPESVFQLMAGVAEALGAIHAAGIVHRDLKPSNVILAPDGPRVIDFGIAQAGDATALTRLGMRVGSPQYMAPEQILGRPPAPAIDVFALGHLAAYAVLGHSPFGTGDAAAVFPRILQQAPDLTGIAPPLRTLIEQCLRKDPDARPTPADVLAGCRAHQTPQTVQLVDTWLPPSMAEAVANHEAPPPPRNPEPPAPTVLPPREPVRPQPQPQRPQVQPQPLYQAPPMAPPPMSQPVAQPVYQAPPRPTKPMMQPTYPYAAPPPNRGILPRSSTGRAVIAIGVIGAVTGLTIALVHGDNSGTSGLGRPTSSATTVHFAGGTVTPGPAASQTPSATSGLDSCLVGTWTGVSEDVTNTINNNPVQFSGLGPTEIFNSDGTGTTDYGTGTDFNATADGESWEEVVKGSATSTWTTKNGVLLSSDIQPSGTWTLFENGNFNNSGPLTLDSAPAPYTCTTTSLTIYPQHGSVTFERSTG
jgi:serine/threonine protein kinase